MAKSKKAPAKKAASKKAGAAPKAVKKAKVKKATTVKSASKSKASKKTAASKTKTAKTKTLAPQKGFPQSKPNQAKTRVDWGNFLTPLDDRLIVQVSAGEKMTSGGLYIPDTVSDTSGNFRGTVLVSGRGHRDSKGKIHPMELKAGDEVLFSEYSGAKLNMLQEDVRILRESEVLGLVVKK